MFMLILTLALLGVLLYLIETYIPMSPPFKLIIRIIVVIALIVYLANLFGVVDIPVPRVR
jgi:hypothetical protein